MAGLADGMALLEPGFTAATDPTQTVGAGGDGCRPSGRVVMVADPVIGAAVDARGLTSPVNLAGQPALVLPVPAGPLPAASR